MTTSLFCVNVKSCLMTLWLIKLCVSTGERGYLCRRVWIWVCIRWVCGCIFFFLWHATHLRPIFTFQRGMNVGTVCLFKYDCHLLQKRSILSLLSQCKYRVQLCLFLRLFADSLAQWCDFYLSSAEEQWYNSVSDVLCVLITGCLLDLCYRNRWNYWVRSCIVGDIQFLL